MTHELIERVVYRRSAVDLVDDETIRLRIGSQDGSHLRGCFQRQFEGFGVPVVTGVHFDRIVTCGKWQFHIIRSDAGEDSVQVSLGNCQEIQQGSFLESEIE